MHEYKNDKITVKWDAKICMHSGVCVKKLRAVFDTTKKPWINVEGAASEEIKKTIDKCPSGALSYNTETKKDI